MNSHFYTAASGLLVEGRRLDMVANNLANLSTSGYRAQRTFASVYRGVAGQTFQAIAGANHGVALAGSYEVPGHGRMEPTGRALDVALGQDDFLEVQTSGGSRYTRAGSLDVDRDGTLLAPSGHPVLDIAGRTISGATGATTIASDGRVLDNEIELGRLNVVRDTTGSLAPQGNHLYAPRSGAPVPEDVPQPELQTGWLEVSGTDALTELIQLIDAQRAFEGYQRLVSLTMNEVNRKAINEIAG